jgi:guanosine-diphosphatase
MDREFEGLDVSILPERLRRSPRLESEQEAMGGYLGVREMRSRSLARRVAVLALLALTWYLAWWRIPKGGKLPIRGSVGMRPLGSICYNDPKTGRRDVVTNRHVIVFDAGSTGSRVHIYEFQYCGAMLSVLVDEVFEEVKPGLSHFHTDPQQAAKSLRPLLETALSRVPQHTQRCTPLVVKATAGLRLLPEHSVSSILQNVRQYVADHPFLLGDGKIAHQEAVNVMDGSEEAVFAWVTVNFLMEKLRPGLIPIPFIPDETSVVMDLGGGSTQIVFAIGRSPDFDHSAHPQYYYKLRLHGNEMDLYQQSYLGFGLMEARKNIKWNHVQRMLADSTDGRSLRFPCFPKGHKEVLTKDGKLITLEGDPAGWDACLTIVTPVFKKEDPCKLHPCSFNGIHQPPIRTKSLIAFSYFFDRLIPLGLSSPVTLFDIDREGRKLCKLAGRSSRYHRLIEENPEWCLDLAYIYSLLRVGYSIDLDQPIIVTKQINGYEAGWSLGAALKLLESAPTCEAPK